MNLIFKSQFWIFYGKRIKEFWIFIRKSGQNWIFSMVCKFNLGVKIQIFGTKIEIFLFVGMKCSTISSNFGSFVKIEFFRQELDF